MSAETALAQLRMDFHIAESRLLATPCDRCPHTLQLHSRVRREQVCIGGGRWPCKCKGFVDHDAPGLFDG